MNILYVDCFSGISGDMMVGALIDMGVPLAFIEEELAGLPVDGYGLSVGRTKRSGIDAADFKVHIEKAQPQRDFRLIKELLLSSSLKESVKSLSLKIFETLAQAEAKVHGVPVESVHFHEVGALDSIVDVVAAAIGIDFLQAQAIYASPLVTGRGMVKTDHGLMPVPAPATAEMLKNIPAESGIVEAELVTPTGAAILKTLVKGFGPMPEMKVERVGYGAGDKDFAEHPNLLRIFSGQLSSEICKVSTERERDTVMVVETSIDDMNPQFFEPLVEALFEAGALDVLLIPVYMKKGRPGTLLQALVPPEKRAKISGIIFKNSTAIGLRFYHADREKLKRHTEKIETPLGSIKVKVLERSPGVVDFRPEYEELKRLAKLHKMSIEEVERKVKAALTDT
ncbi:MAG: nickel pincer cofactor biosynthesis protein LarC [Proteobacteria bacterium]|nr:nickel pincer cofactor biosynthesis protein LarC [Pseudomonadota bacterium]